MSEQFKRIENMPVHVVYAVTLMFLLATRYYVYFAPGTSMADINFGRALGANMGYFLIWGLGYYLCLTSPRKGLVTSLGFVAVLAGPLAAPIAGYMLLAIIYFFRKRQLKSIRQTSSGPESVAVSESV